LFEGDYSLEILSELLSGFLGVGMDDLMLVQVVKFWNCLRAEDFANLKSLGTLIFIFFRPRKLPSSSLIDI
jgi:hypothetical protein